MIVTIDGPSGVGKTTVSRKVSEALGCICFDTGALYRSLAWFLLNEGIELSDMSAVEAKLPFFDLRIEIEGRLKRYWVGGQEVTALIRTEQVSLSSSIVAAYPKVRATLVKIQQEFAQGRCVVFEGRDLGSVVFPRADLKVFLTADPEARALRRVAELQLADRSVNAEEIFLSLMARDKRDSEREHSPLLCPSDAVVVNTTDMPIDDVVAAVVHMARELDVSLSS